MPAWAYAFFRALFLTFWEAYVEVQAAKNEAIREVPDDKALAVRARFRDAVARLRAKEARDPGPDSATSGGAGDQGVGMVRQAGSSPPEV